MKHAIQVLSYEKRKLINRLYEMQEHNDLDRLSSQEGFTDADFQSVKKKISQTDDAIKLIEATDKKPSGRIPGRGTVTVGKGT